MIALLRHKPHYQYMPQPAVLKYPISVLILCFLLSSCESYDDPDQQKLYSPGFEKMAGREDLVMIDLDSMSSFAELRDKMGRLTCQRTPSAITFEYQNKKYFLTGYADCPTTHEVACYFRKNFINIKNDSVVTDLFNDNRLPIEELESELISLTTFPSNFKLQEDIMKPALITLYIDEAENISTTRKVLSEIVKSFQKINTEEQPGFFEYAVLFSFYDPTRIPPPPPLPEQVN